ncbi:hypothetical protein M427DRAFT_401781 [Gonapodya prolifera JEL478]|uniref:L domain-like protein n=1 Tax=Gonapodya prolifera (strain JEL478) TaxID=1344416 RepID=A0A139ATN1_GONPJ|nr:hypothetical protein M427DRAFT_401781 [Gonapodya prolifera JEL478]|eukprot:KXS20086.1 hypothetical protein M427DRAFT_401781 [Gonapodya prolifera JEL478]
MPDTLHHDEGVTGRSRGLASVCMLLAIAALLSPPSSSCVAQTHTIAHQGLFNEIPSQIKAQYSPSPDCEFVEVLFDQSQKNVTWPRGSCCYEGPNEVVCYGQPFFCTDGRIIQLSASSLNLSGSIPASVGNLTMVRTIELGFNKLTGQIPIELMRLPKTALPHPVQQPAKRAHPGHYILFLPSHV